MTVLTLPTPAELEAEALDLERRADIKDVAAVQSWVSTRGAEAFRKDAAIFRSEAASKRAKAERMRKTVKP